MTPILEPVHRAATAQVEAAMMVNRVVGDGGGYAGAYLAGLHDGLIIAITDAMLARAVVEAMNAEIGLDGGPAREILNDLRRAVGRPAGR